MTKLQGADAINKEISSIKSAGAKFDKRVQDCAVACLDHMEQHGDYTLLVNLYHALPKASRRASMAAWILRYSKLTANTDKATKKEKPFLLDKTKANDMVGAAAEMWHSTGKPEQTPDTILDLQKAVLSLLARVKKAKASGRGIKGLDDETITALASLKA